jgi:hypothetical protein
MLLKTIKENRGNAIQTEIAAELIDNRVVSWFDNL